MNANHVIRIILLLSFLSGVTSAAQLGTAFTYQGRLTDGGQPANGNYDLRIKIYNPDPGGRGITLTNLSVPVASGALTTTIDSTGLFWDGTAYWVELAVRPSGTPVDFTVLSPDQPLMPVPFTMYATHAGNAWKFNGQDSTAYAPATGSSAYAPASGSPAYVAKAGDTMTGPLLLPADGFRAGADQLVLAGGRIGIGTATPSAQLEVAGLVKASAFSGSGAGITGLPGMASYKENGPFSLPPVATGSNAIAQGNQVQALGDNSVIGGGQGNVANHPFAGIGGGRNNSAGGVFFGCTTVAGGEENQALGDWSTIGGGHGNSASVTAFGCSTVSGGWLNNVAADYGSIGGGSQNTVSGAWSTIGGGQQNGASGSLFGRSTVSGGLLNNAAADFGSIGGGSHNTVLGGHGTIGGGQSNLISTTQGPWSVIGGGLSNLVSGMAATIPGGSFNEATEWSTFAAGRRAKARHSGAFVWADGVDQDFASTAANQFSIRASGGVGITSPKGISLNAGNQPLITSGWDPFDGTSGDKAGLGRWGLFMEPYALVAGIPAEDVGPRMFSVAKYNLNGTRQPLLSVISDGNINIGSRLFVRSDGNVDINSTLYVRSDRGVGINTSNPLQQLDVAGGDILVRGPSNFISGAASLFIGDGNNYVRALRGEGLRLGVYQGADALAVQNGGNVGIGTTEPVTKLHVVGTTRTSVLEITGGSDVAEPFEVSQGEPVPKGTVMVIDELNPGQLRVSSQSYDKHVAGVVSGAGGLSPGVIISQQGLTDRGAPVALSGRVYTLADATYGPIQPGDLLTTSDIAGHAMKVADHSKAQGAIIGKAMGSLPRGRGLVLVLVTLQ